MSRGLATHYDPQTLVLKHSWLHIQSLIVGLAQGSYAWRGKWQQQSCHHLLNLHSFQSFGWFQYSFLKHHIGLRHQCWPKIAGGYCGLEFMYFCISIATQFLQRNQSKHFDQYAEWSRVWLVELWLVQRCRWSWLEAKMPLSSVWDKEEFPLPAVQTFGISKAHALLRSSNSQLIVCPYWSYWGIEALHGASVFVWVKEGSSLQSGSKDSWSPNLALSHNVKQMQTPGFRFCPSGSF